ncbi:MAG TPA: hypothetical protein VJU86_10890 [Pyrinomonadaceae bacterium]|nr:hypothetical protein [Pyrinomonadaceae bacterium]
MKEKRNRFNWQIWAGFLLSFIASLSYPLIFVNWPLTRDFPWVTLALYVVAAVLLVIGVKRAFASGRSRKAKIAAPILATVSIAIMGLFLFSILIAARWLPASAGAPKVGERAPEFTLADMSGKTISLTELLTTPIAANGAKPKGVLLIFYRGYW